MNGEHDLAREGVSTSASSPHLTKLIAGYAAFLFYQHATSSPCSFLINENCAEIHFTRYYLFGTVDVVQDMQCSLAHAIVTDRIEIE